jgi:hypothetical protein
MFYSIMDVEAESSSAVTEDPSNPLATCLRANRDDFVKTFSANE